MIFEYLPISLIFTMAEQRNCDRNGKIGKIGKNLTLRGCGLRVQNRLAIN